MFFCCCCNKKPEIIIQFYKTSLDSLLKQLTCYLNDSFQSNGNICANYCENDYDYYVYEDRNSYTKLTVKCKLIQNKFNYKMIIYEIVHHL